MRRNHSVETYRPLIEEGIARGLPFICANPDLVVDVGDKRYLCAGSIAAEYERCGGSVFWAGKPHPAAYLAALERTGELRGTAPDRTRILAIGDAVRTDLAAAQGMGVDALFIASGIHNDEVLVGRRDRSRQARCPLRAAGNAAGRCRHGATALVTVDLCQRTVIPGLVPGSSHQLAPAFAGVGCRQQVPA